MTWRCVLLTGATSAIGQAIARKLASEGCELVLLARDYDELERVASDLRSRWQVRATGRLFEATETASHHALFDDIVQSTKLDGAILCHGYMVPEGEAARSWELAEQMILVNFCSYVSVCSILSRCFRKQGHGFICAISSVAGDRGRQSNFTYGSAKGGLTVYLQGLRNAMHSHNVHVLTVKPGFVDTSMTWGLLSPGSPLLASPERVAADVIGAIRKKTNVIYTPWFWRWIMLILRMIPEAIFKRLKL